MRQRPSRRQRSASSARGDAAGSSPTDSRLVGGQTDHLVFGRLVAQAVLAYDSDTDFQARNEDLLRAAAPCAVRRSRATGPGPDRLHPDRARRWTRCADNRHDGDGGPTDVEVSEWAADRLAGIGASPGVYGIDVTGQQTITTDVRKPHSGHGAAGHHRRVPAGHDVLHVGRGAAAAPAGRIGIGMMRPSAQFTSPARRRRPAGGDRRRRHRRRDRYQRQTAAAGPAGRARLRRRDRQHRTAILDAAQERNAKIIVAVALGRRLGGTGAAIGVAVALAESTLFNYANDGTSTLVGSAEGRQLNDAERAVARESLQYPA